MAFTTEDITVQRLMSQVVYTIPRNQRKYVWDERNWRFLRKVTRSWSYESDPLWSSKVTRLS